MGDNTLSLYNTQTMFYQITSSRSVTYNGKRVSFAAGEIIAAKRFERFCPHNVSTWATKMTTEQTKIANANVEVDRINKESFSYSQEMSDQRAIIEDVLMNKYGLHRSDFCFGYGPTNTYPDAAHDTFWVGVKLIDLGGRLMNKARKPVSLGWKSCNFVAAQTFISHLNKGEPLFAFEA